MQARNPPPRRKPRSSRLTYRALQKMKPGQSLADPACKGLRFRCAEGSTGKRTHIYGEWRGQHPLTKKRITIRLGKPPSEDDFWETVVPEEVGTPIRITWPGGQRTRSTVVSLDDALEPFRKKSRGLNRKLAQGLDPRAEISTEGTTVGQAFDLQLAHSRSAKLSDRTVRSYQAGHAHLADWAKVPLRKITPAMLRERRDRIGKKHGEATANSMLRTLRAAWNLARAEDPNVPEWPKRAVKPFPRKKKPTALPEKHLSAWCDELRDVPEPRRSVYLLGALTGLRRGDLLSIRREHVDLKAGTILIPKPKGGEERAFTLPLSDAALAVVKRVLRSHNSEWLFPADGPTRGGAGHLVEVRPRKGEFSMSWSLHDLRRVYISAATAADVHPYVLKLLVNHSVPRDDVTAGYVDVSTEVLRRETEKVTAYLLVHGLSAMDEE